MSYESCETESISWSTTAYEVGKNYRGVLADLTYNLVGKGVSKSDRHTYDDLPVVCRHHRQQLECPPAPDNSREGFGPLRADLGLMPE